MSRTWLNSRPHCVICVHAHVEKPRGSVRVELKMQKISVERGPEAFLQLGGRKSQIFHSGRERDEDSSQLRQTQNKLLNNDRCPRELEFIITSSNKHTDVTPCVFRTRPSRALTSRRVTEQSTSATPSTVTQMCSSSQTVSCRSDGQAGRTSRPCVHAARQVHCGGVHLSGGETAALVMATCGSLTSTHVTPISPADLSAVLTSQTSSFPLGGTKAPSPPSSIHPFFIHECWFIQHSRCMNPIDVGCCCHGN